MLRKAIAFMLCMLGSGILTLYTMRGAFLCLTAIFGAGSYIYLKKYDKAQKDRLQSFKQTNEIIYSNRLRKKFDAKRMEVKM